MKKLQLPFVSLPQEFVTLLKSNLSVTTSPAPIFDIIRPNKALYMVLEKAFKEFDDGRGVEKLMTALGWGSFRDRMASLFVYKSIHGDFPLTSHLDLVEEIKEFENFYRDHSVHGYSRLFLLGFYLRMANIKVQKRQNNQFLEMKVPREVLNVLRVSQGKSEKIDWLILIVMHLIEGLGEKAVLSQLVSGKKFNEIYALLNKEQRESMHDNLLAYGSSINEPDFFLYEKV